MHNSLKLAAVLVAVSATAASAQGNGRNRDIPPGQRPVDGMCRVWVTGVAPGRQSAPTDCATAEAQARITANSRVIYGGFPGKKGAHSDDNLLTRRRQLPDGSWVIDRYRRDANGNLTIVSTRPVSKVDKAQRKAAKHQRKVERRAEKRQDKIEDRAEKRQDKIEGRAERRRDNDLTTSLGASVGAGRGNSGGKGKGKH
jgi:hypothetical protein